ncbi:S-type anion channel SLAH1 [Bienertia sinuspersici]
MFSSTMEFHTMPSLPPHPTLITISSPSKHEHEHDYNDHHRCTSVVIRSISSILTRFHAGYFRITLSLGSQALLWKNLIEPTSHNTINPLIHHIFHRFHPITFLSLWSFSLAVLLLLSFIYLLRCIFHLDMVKAEFLHHVGVNYLFAPWISWLLLLQCSPWIDCKTGPYVGLWWALVIPVVVLDVKIYGQWFTTKRIKYNLTAVANPTSQMSVIGNLVGSTAAARMGWNETAMVLFSLGMVHYLVLFVTLYQRLSGSDKLPAMLRPVFFLFFAAPGMGSLAWGAISGKFDTTAKMLFFLSVFLFMSLDLLRN